MTKGARRQAATSSGPTRSASAPRRRRRGHALLDQRGCRGQLVAPLGARRSDIAAHSGGADFNVVLYPEIADDSAPAGSSAPSSSRTKHGPDRRRRHGRLHREVAESSQASIPTRPCRHPFLACRGTPLGRFDLPDRQAGVHLRRCDPRHRSGARRPEELGFEVVGLGTYSREFAREVRAGGQALRRRGADHRRLSRGRGAIIAEPQPELVLGTQMERHIAKRLGHPCAVISAPVHVQDFPARYSPQMGFEGANVGLRHLGPSADDGPARGASARRCSAKTSSSDR
jgi:light-independent protochlorophyllide reductase subunit B